MVTEGTPVSVKSKTLLLQKQKPQIQDTNSPHLHFN